jgi:hypothetical protein
MVAAMLATSLGRPIHAQSGTTVISKARAWQLSVDTRYLSGMAYRPVRITLTRVTPAPVDSRLTVVFTPQAMYYGPTMELQVSEELDVPAGATTVSTVLAVPATFPWNVYTVQVEENGAHVKALDQNGVSVDGWNSTLFEDSCRMLAIRAPGSAPVDSTTLGALFHVFERNNNYGVTPNTTPTTTPYNGILELASDALYDRWIDYSGLDLIIIPLAELEAIAVRDPSALDALLAWQAAGGNLVVCGVGEQYERLGAVEDRLQMKRTTGLPAEPADGWTLPNPASQNTELHPAFNVLGNAVYQSQGAAAAPVAPITPDPPPPPDFFRVRRRGMGLVVAVGRDEVFPGTASEWAWLLNTLGADRLISSRRMGLSNLNDNDDFWNFLIEGVGLAPVGAFRVMISLFVVVIGPLNFYWLYKTRRLHLLLFIVPCVAAVVTLSLFGWALFADGLGVRTRARSITWIDQHSGRAVCWSRLSYYAGISPGSLTFSDDTAVFPYYGYPAEQSPRRSMEWVENDQVLTRGWIYSRTSTQFITVRSRQSSRGLNLIRPAGGGPPQVENALGTTVRKLWMQDDSGQLFKAMDVEPGATAVLAPASDPAAAFDELRAMLLDLRPTTPSDFNRNESMTLFGTRMYRSYYYYGSTGQQVTQISSLLEIGLAELAVPRFTMEPSTYVAIVDRSPEVEFGIDDFEEQNGLHVIVGEW